METKVVINTTNEAKVFIFEKTSLAETLRLMIISTRTWMEADDKKDELKVESST